MSKQAVLICSSLIACLMIVSGCTRPPTDAMEAAEAKLNAASEAEVDKYAPVEYEAAAAELDKAQAHMAAEEYSDAKTAAERTIELIDVAGEEARVQRGLVEIEVKEAITAFRDRWKEISETIEAGRSRDARELAREAREYADSINPQLIELNSNEKWYDLKVLLEEANTTADSFAERAGG